MTKPDSEDEDRDDLDEEDEDESPPPPKAKAKSKASPAKTSGPAPKGKPPALTPAHALGIAVLALAVGGAGGWFGHIQKAKAALRAEVAAAPAGSGAPSGPCGAWQSKICASVGEQSAACQQAKAAAGLLVSATCETALGALPATLAKVKAERASCDKLVAKLCQDLPPGSKTCDMVKERTPSFPSERCAQMLQNYDKVIGELKQMDQQGGMGAPPMTGPGGMRPMAMPPGAMPGGMPHVQVQQAPPHP